MPNDSIAPAATMEDYAANRSPAPAPADNGAASPAALPAQEPAAAGPAESTADPAAQPNPEHQQRQRERGGFQRRINELTRRLNDSERRADLLLETVRGQSQRPEPQKVAPPEDKAPREEDFPGDYRAFLQADAKWQARQETREELNRDRQQREQQQRDEQERSQRERAATQVQGVMQDFGGRNVAYATENPGFDTAIDALESVEIGPHNHAFVSALLIRPDSAKLLHHLAENPQVAQHISRLPPAAQGSALGEFAAFVTSRRHSTAPPPGNPVAGRAAASSALPNTGSMDDYAAARERMFKRA